MKPLRKRPLPWILQSHGLKIQNFTGTTMVHPDLEIYNDTTFSLNDYWFQIPRTVAQKTLNLMSLQLRFGIAPDTSPRHFHLPVVSCRRHPDHLLSLPDSRPSGVCHSPKVQEAEPPKFLEDGLHDLCVRKSIWNKQVWQMTHGYTSVFSRNIEYFGNDLLRHPKSPLPNSHIIASSRCLGANTMPLMEEHKLPRVNNMPKLNELFGRTGNSAQSPTISDLMYRLTELDMGHCSHGTTYCTTPGEWWLQ